MWYQLYSKNLELTDAMRGYFDKRLQHIQKLQQSVISCRVDISRDEHHKKGDVYRIEINLVLPKRMFRSEQYHADAYAAMDLVVDSIVQQVTRWNDRQRSLMRRMGSLFRRK